VQPDIARKIERIDWYKLRIVLEVARSQSIKRAAGRLAMTEGTISRHISAVEEELGVDLFERTARGMNLTLPGATLVEHLYRAEAAIEAGLDDACRRQVQPFGTVRLTTVPVLANYVLTPSSPPLFAAYPDLELELIGVPTALSLRQREADLAVRLTRPSSDFDVLTRRLGNLDYGVYCSTAKSAEQEVLPWLTYGKDMASLPQALWIEERASQHKEAVYPLRNYDADGLISAAVCGAGKTLLPRLVATNLGSLCELTGYDDLPQREVWLLVHPNVASTMRIRVVVEWLDEIFSPRSSNLPGS